MRLPVFTFSFLIIFSACGQNPGTKTSMVNGNEPADPSPETAKQKKNKEGIKTIHVFVALCDNKYQGIVPVGSRTGNGQDAANNLYWGAAYGVKAFFSKKNSDWKLVRTDKGFSDTILERLVFKHKTKSVYLLADAYDGKFIKKTTLDFLRAASGANPVAVKLDSGTVYFGGSANLLAYTGHDGLMDFNLENSLADQNDQKRETIILACYSKNYFAPFIKKSGAFPLIWSTGLMAPEAYILHNAFKKWVDNKPAESIRLAAAEAYAQYQKCSLKAAGNLLVTGY